MMKFQFSATPDGSSVQTLNPCEASWMLWCDKLPRLQLMSIEYPTRCLRGGETSNGGEISNGLETSNGREMCSNGGGISKGNVGTSDDGVPSMDEQVACQCHPPDLGEQKAPPGNSVLQCDSFPQQVFEAAFQALMRLSGTP